MRFVGVSLKVQTRALPSAGMLLGGGALRREADPHVWAR